MVFSSLFFLFLFLPVVLLLYYILPCRFRNAFLFIASLFFYAWGEPVYIGLMLFSTLVDYSHGLLIERFRNNKKRARLILLSSICINLGLLCFFKYADLLLGTVNGLWGTAITPLELPLPIGISFYTFQTMSYTIDVYRQEAPVQKNFIAFGAYVSLFPQLIAGPIVRYQTVAEQLLNRRENADLLASGLGRFVKGLGKKVLLANNIGMLWQQVQQVPAGELTLVGAWLGIIAFALQIYFDFSGYSDMAIGLGRMFGFRFLENFNLPYIAESITDFWRRWHISLGTWFREYVYIPLGGNRRQIYRNLFIVWSLTGIWHGASWNYLVWGLYYGVILAMEKAFLLRALQRLPKLLRHGYALVLVLVGWVFFVFEDLSLGYDYLQRMLGLKGGGLINSETLYLLSNYGLLLIVAIVFALLRPNTRQQLPDTPAPLKKVAAVAAYMAILVLSTAYLVDSTFNPFLYFRF